MKASELLTKIALLITGFALWYNGFWGFFSSLILTAFLIFISFARDASLKKRGIERWFLNFGQLWILAYILLFSLIYSINLLIGGHWVLKPSLIPLGATNVAGLIDIISIGSDFIVTTITDILFGDDDNAKVVSTKTCNKCGATNDSEVTVCWNCHNTGNPIDFSSVLGDNNYQHD